MSPERGLGIVMDENRLQCHLHVRRRRFFPAAFAIVGSVALALASACNENPPFIIGTPGVDAAAPPAFTDTPRSDDAGDEQSLTAYCPSNKCPVGRTTCPASLFLCDVDLETDRNNCGACGVQCPFLSSSEAFECVEGRCVMQCEINSPMFDCDGVPDNGCELRADTNDNCGGCGVRCSDPTKPCVYRRYPHVGCGCLGDDLYCEGQCVDSRSADSNCGACGKACDPMGDGGVLYANTYYGCLRSSCGQLKCVGGWGNCDGDVTNGCEANLLTSDNCGSCGNACAPGQKCQIDSDTNKPECMCPEGRTFCSDSCVGDICRGRCFDLTMDRDSCGACGNQCTFMTLTGARGICKYGVCSQQCIQGRADCNGNIADGCEVNTNNDPMNCGECGRVCNAVAGQACVGGRCVVEPCEDIDDAGGGPK